jgi:dienelactone hydrolase
MFGLSDGTAENAGNGQHLASWGYVVAMPRLPDDAEDRTASVQHALAYLETQTRTAGSFLHQKVDAGRLATAGHSLGGTTALSVAARDGRVRAVVALDPVYHTGGPGQPEDPVWDLVGEGSKIVVPSLVLGALPSSCNSDADYAEIYPVLGATHKAQLLITGASHCDFADPGSRFCGFMCGATDRDRTRLSQKYMAAWFNYYLHHDTGSFGSLYGSEANHDIANGLVQRQLNTAPRDVHTTGMAEAVLLEWTAYDHPMVAGYSAHRRQAREEYPDVPQLQVGRTGGYLDEGLAGGQIYLYVLCSHDRAGNRHQLSPEISARTLGEPPPPPDLDERLYLPLVRRR